MQDSIPDYHGPEKRAQINALQSEINRLERWHERKPELRSVVAEIGELKEKLRGLVG